MPKVPTARLSQTTSPARRPPALNTRSKARSALSEVQVPNGVTAGAEAPDDLSLDKLMPKKDSRITPRAERLLNREVNRSGFAETPEAAAHWEAMASQTASLEEYKAKQKTLEEKVKKLKGKIHAVRRELEATQAREAIALQSRDEFESKMQTQFERAEYEMKEKFKYWKALTEAKFEIDLLNEEIETGEAPGGYAQGPMYCPPLP
ncbi:hypothetical protein FA13DRAFT_1807774 [Coprinellus micaceus]|uniref:Uncharacterized protein n=1 Tax=Coprinellus micaceus TaxID=71717 RepID=A0A4Y7R5J4_COPMI|nr:hypothetical protein FA13DRAFT_1807774 [Coprinellus micaceus]